MPESDEITPNRQRRESMVLLAAWVAFAVVVVFFAKQNFSVPGLYYDEAVFAGMAKDFLATSTHGQHMPDHETVSLGARPFPLFVQTYLGALKSWMLIPAFSLFGPTVAVLRASNVFWQLLALLFLMLAAWRWLGIVTALVAAALLVVDPTFFFVSTLDWGVAVPSFLCRCACFYFAVQWNRSRKIWNAFFLGLFAGLGFFNKADFVVFLLAIGLALLVCYWRPFLKAVREHSVSVAFASLGFAAGAGPMLLKIPRMLALTVSGPHPNAPGEFSVKVKTLLSMYDGSHFYRLMNVGGVFERMYDGAAGPRAAIGIAFIAALISFAFLVDKNPAKTRQIVFLIITAALTTLGVFILPDAVRIHHAVLVYPLPQLIIAAIAGAIWNAQKLQRTIALIGVGVVCLSGFWSIAATQKLVRDTGGRGRWSESLNEFCREVRDRTDLTIVSLDWGFNEQLIFLTAGPQLSEPFWEFNQTLPPLPPNPKYIYLAHPPEYSVLKYDVAYLDQLQKSGANVEITPHFDRQHEIAFYTIRFR